MTTMRRLSKPSLRNSALIGPSRSNRASMPARLSNSTTAGLLPVRISPACTTTTIGRSRSWTSPAPETRSASRPSGSPPRPSRRIAATSPRSSIPSPPRRSPTRRPIRRHPASPVISPSSRASPRAPSPPRLCAACWPGVRLSSPPRTASSRPSSSGRSKHTARMLPREPVCGLSPRTCPATVMSMRWLTGSATSRRRPLEPRPR